MGNKVVTFTEQELDDYQVSDQSDEVHFHTANFSSCIAGPQIGKDCTFFTRKEILR